MPSNTYATRLYTYYPQMQEKYVKRLNRNKRAVVQRKTSQNIVEHLQMLYYIKCLVFFLRQPLSIRTIKHNRSAEGCPVTTNILFFSIKETLSQTVFHN